MVSIPPAGRVQVVYEPRLRSIVNIDCNGAPKGKEQIAYTLDPHPELDRNGKRR